MATPAIKVRLKSHDPFDLILLLARSQSDPRKAVAELVQNSLDAEARHVEVTWFQEKGARCLRIVDDGGGVFPELPREEALRKIATTIGHSHKKNLTPAQRRELMVLGRYGIGLLGFWSIGHVLEIRSRVGGGDAWCLTLVEEEREAEVSPVRAQRMFGQETRTEVTIRGVHDSVQRLIRPARLQAYLSSELRGQLLARGAEIRLHDRVARGRATKEFVVKAKPFLGTPLETFRTLDVPGFESARLELYLVSPDEGRSGIVTLACGGTTVLDDLALVEGVEAPRPPWNSGQLEGVVDFPDLTVAPSTRRGFVSGPASDAFLAALVDLERQLQEHIEQEEHRRAEQRKEQVAREIRRAFRPIARRLPEYDLFHVKAAGSTPGAGGPQGAALPETAPEAAEDGASVPQDGEAELLAGHAEEAAPAALLFPAGPLASVQLQPGKARVAPGATRSFRARALDAQGEPASGAVQFWWHLEGEGELLNDGGGAVYQAPDSETTARVHVVAEQGPVLAEAEAQVAVLEDLGEKLASGIPEPRPVHAPAETWRSRIRGGRWEYNDGHPDYRSVADVEARRLRYLIHLFAKELVLRNFGRPGQEELLERFVEVLTHLGAGDRRA